MPRKATGRPAGRPTGTGHLDNPERITVALPGAMVTRLEACRHGRKLSACVRELLEHALTCPKRQTQPRAVTATVTDTDAPQSPARRRKRQAAPAD